MSWHRIKAVILRNWYGTIRSYDRMVDAFYWVTIDLLIWGVTGRYFEQVSSDPNQFMFMLAGSVILWNVVYRSQSDIGIGVLDELWNRNMINLFASPLKISEWLIATCIFSTLKVFVSLCFASVLAFLLYSFNIFTFSWYLIPCYIILTISGWSLGLLLVTLILRFTTKVQSLAWTLVWLLAPVSAIYFPVSALPDSVQRIAAMLPMSYVFEEMRSLLISGQLQSASLWIALLLSCFWLIFFSVAVYFSFRRALNQGLVKLY